MKLSAFAMMRSREINERVKTLCLRYDEKQRKMLKGLESLLLFGEKCPKVEDICHEKQRKKSKVPKYLLMRLKSD